MSLEELVSWFMQLFLGFLFVVIIEPAPSDSSFALGFGLLVSRICVQPRGEMCARRFGEQSKPSRRRLATAWPRCLVFRQFMLSGIGCKLPQELARRPH